MRLGSQPIEPRLIEIMNKLGRMLDRRLNPDGEAKWGFVLMCFPFDSKPGRCNYISNAHRKDVITLLHEQLRYFEGAPEIDSYPEVKQ